MAHVEALLRQIESTKECEIHEGNSSQDLLELPLRVIGRARQLATDSERFIEKATVIAEDGTRKVKRATWPLHASKAKALSEEFRWLYLEISAVYSVHTSYALHSHIHFILMNITYYL